MYALALAYVATAAVSLALSALNLRHLRRHGRDVPEELASTIDRERLQRIVAYTEDRARFGLLRSFLSKVAVFFVIFGGGLELFDRFIGGLSGSFVLRGVLFFLGASLVESMAALPFSVYSQFRIEARHGFNRMTPGLYVADTAKGLVLGAVLAAIAAGGALWLVASAPDTWWLWVWGFFAVLGVVLMYISPYVIEPLFFKMEPLKVDGLAGEVRALAERAGVHVSRVLTMDASRRSAHSNAYFTGIGRVKRVVLFDTLLAQLTHPEILSVLSHELGHWRKHHIVKRMAFSYALTLVLAYIAFRLTAGSELATLIGAEDLSFLGKIVVLSVLGSVVSFVFTPLASWWSRKHEWEADDFATELWGAPADLASALAKMSRENLSNLHPHPLYAAFYYSHPPVVERVRALRLASPVAAGGTS